MSCSAVSSCRRRQPPATPPTHPTHRACRRSNTPSQRATASAVPGAPAVFQRRLHVRATALYVPTLCPLPRAVHACVSSADLAPSSTQTLPHLLLPTPLLPSPPRTPHPRASTFDPRRAPQAPPSCGPNPVQHCKQRRQASAGSIWYVVHCSRRGSRGGGAWTAPVLCSLAGFIVGTGAVHVGPARGAAPAVTTLPCFTMACPPVSTWRDTPKAHADKQCSQICAASSRHPPCSSPHQLTTTEQQLRQSIPRHHATRREWQL